MQILIAAGGTGGHVYPAIAIAEAAVDSDGATILRFIGSVDGFERPLIEKAPVAFIDYNEVQAGPINGVGAVRGAISVIKIGIGTLQSLALMMRQRPDALLMTGGWVCVPAGIAAWMLRVPSLIYLPDIEPGLTIKALRHLATRVAVTAEASYPYFRAGQAVATGYPVRKALLSATRAGGQARFGLDPARQTLLVFGGSRGARTINRAVIAVLPDLLADGVQVIHVTGALDWQEVSEQVDALGLAAALRGRYHSYEYLHDDMALALAAADLVVSRSGASVLGELPLFGLPAILVPYPYAWRYQKVNADYLVDHGAALLLEDARMNEALLPMIRQVLGDSVTQHRMATAALALAHPDGAGHAARELLQLAKKG